MKPTDKIKENGMDKQKAGYHWHVHHDCLLEYCRDYDERIEHILECKPEHEHELRLRLFRLVKGELPIWMVVAVCAYDEVRHACGEVGGDCNEVGGAYDEAWCAYDKAMRICNDEILTLHAKECPDCPWDGETIFPEVER